MHHPRTARGPCTCAQAAAERMAGILVMGRTRMPKSLLENAAIALGRLCMTAPGVVAPHMGHFFVPWCQVRAWCWWCLWWGRRRLCGSGVAMVVMC